jgi:hypothetical protein
MLGVLGSAGAAICLAPCGSAVGELNLGTLSNFIGSDGSLHTRNDPRGRIERLIGRSR